MKKSEKHYPLRLPQVVYDDIQILARLHNRSVNQEIITFLQQAILTHTNEIKTYLKHKENV